jgi:hypothetical protein
LLFSVLANVMIAMCAFVSVVLFFRSRSLLQKPPVATQRPRASVVDPGRSLESDFNRPQPALRSVDEAAAQRQARGRAARRPAQRQGVEQPFGLDLVNGHVETA